MSPFSFFSHGNLIFHFGGRYLRDDVIHGEVISEVPGGRGGEFRLDLPAHGDKTTRDLFFQLKEAWQIARHSVDGADLDLEEGEELLQ